MPFDLVDNGDCNQAAWNRNDFLNSGFTVSFVDLSLDLFHVVPNKNR